MSPDPNYVKGTIKQLMAGGYLGVNDMVDRAVNVKEKAAR